ncbi:SAM-dependent methyltransferase [Pseudomonas sp. RIT-PI-S]|uniref:class I SAM-dependent methyltransferase n=1 Tax=Pseudomonas sp. RIT-PI-S TaxID=3035295 RepID=UPI0021D9D8CD|nr:SAM-dependent methyltransferase [Pseudomonas sp. RIT-PI-S]
MPVAPVPPLPTDDPREVFLDHLRTALAENRWVKLVLARHVGSEPDLERITVKPLTVKGQARLGFVLRYRTRDITRHHGLDEGLAEIASALPERFRNAHLQATDETLQLEFGKKKARLHRSKAEQVQAPASAEHDRAKQRWLDLDRPFLAALGVTDRHGVLVPAMSRKWKQINKFIEVFAHAFTQAGLPAEAPVRVADFGSGKGYLTFAIHDYLRHGLGREALVTGVELRQDMVQLCNQAAAQLDHPGLHFEHGDVRSVVPARIEVMIALHACDVATDYAIHTGIRSQAAIIMCSPCCHKQLRPQMSSPEPLGPMLQYGLHLGQQAEMLTDSLRALYLEACGYETKVFEFVSLEHTSKNKMILAVKRSGPVDAAPRLARIQALKAFYGVREHCLETLLQADGLLG